MVDYLGSSEGPGAYGVENKDTADAGADGENKPAYEYKTDAPTPAMARKSTIGKDTNVNLWESILTDVVKRDE